MKIFKQIFLTLAGLGLALAPLQGQELPKQTLIKNVQVFDGINEKRIENAQVLVDDNPLENLDLVADPHKNFVLIMKDGKIYKNTLNN